MRRLELDRLISVQGSLSYSSRNRYFTGEGIEGGGVALKEKQGRRRRGYLLCSPIRTRSDKRSALNVSFRVNFRNKPNATAGLNYQVGNIVKDPARLWCWGILLMPRSSMFQAPLVCCV